MIYSKRWYSIFISIFAGIIFGYVLVITWKYSNYALYGDIKQLQSHTDILAHKYQDLQYQMDVITSLDKQQSSIEGVSGNSH